jgi:O-antigen ligase
VIVAVALLALVARSGETEPGFCNLIPVRLFLLFTLTCFFSLFFTSRLYPSIYFFLRLVLYAALFPVLLDVFSIPTFGRAVCLLLVVSVLFVSILGIVQFVKQSSVFNNYVFFGEQPYNLSTPRIARESYGGVSRIPPYGTFPHPNVLAGFLTIFLTMFVGSYATRRKVFAGGNLRVPTVCAIALGLIVLALTKSYTAWAALLCGFLILFFSRGVKNPRLRLILYTSLMSVAVLLGLTLPFYKNILTHVLPDNSITSASVERRSSFLLASYRMILQKPLFGRGLNSYTYSFGSFISNREMLPFSQPVHNVFALISSEVGLLGAALFLSIFLYSIYRTVYNGSFVYGVIMIQIIVISGFDHYFFTIHQTYLLFILTLALGLTYTKDKDCL